MFTLNFPGQELIVPMVVNLVHESMFPIFVFMMLQEKSFFLELMVSWTVINTVFERYWCPVCRYQIIGFYRKWDDS